jgi:thiamine monophosphate kinase
MLATWSQQLKIELSIIGEIEKGQGICCISPNGTIYNPQKAGFEHFSRKS